MATIPFNQVSPQLTTKEISDTYIKKNFDELNKYFAAQNQFLNFRFFELVFTAATASYSVAHGFSFAPQDVMVMKLIGPGNVTFNYGLFDTSNINITTSGACRIRFFIGSYWGGASTAATSPKDSQTFYAVAPTNAASSTTTIVGSTVPAGTISAYAGAYVANGAPSGYLFCDGSNVSRVTYAALFAACGTTYGTGDGVNTFSLPDVRGRVIAGLDANAAGTFVDRLTSSSGIPGRILASAGGSETVALTVAQLAAHHHAILGGLVGSTLPINNAGTSAFCGLSSNTLTYFNTAPSGGNQFLQDTGSGSPHVNAQPTIVLNYLIKT